MRDRDKLIELGLGKRAEASFKKRIKKTDSCWIFTGTKNPDGYGSVMLTNLEKGIRGSIGTHVLAYKLWKGKIGNRHVLHKCDNPACVNPDHLFLGTHQDNMHDMISKGRKGSWDQRGEVGPRAILKNHEAQEILRRYNEGQRIIDISKDFPSVKYATIWAVAKRANFKWL